MCWVGEESKYSFLLAQAKNISTSLFAQEQCVHFLLAQEVDERKARQMEIS